MEKKWFYALEKIWEREISGGLMFQSKAKVYKELEDAGLVQEVEVVLPGSPPVTIRGWVLTHPGRFEYCRNCPEV